MEQITKKICLVSFLVHDAFFVPLSQLREIIGAISPGARSITVLSPLLKDRMNFDPARDVVVHHKIRSQPLLRILHFFILNLKISYNIILRLKDSDEMLFFWQTGLLLPMITARLIGKRVIWVLPSSMEKMAEHNQDFLNVFLMPFHSLSRTIADRIILFSPGLIQDWDLQKYSGKIDIISYPDYIDFTVFTPLVPFSKRSLIIGYIGRLSEEKGVSNFVQALPDIIGTREDITILIGGEGDLKEYIVEFIRENRLEDRVILAGWIPHGNLPHYLNQLKCLVIPSYTESGPLILLEAIACGTPVIATKVGIVPEVITDGRTGYILESNTPKCIATTVIRVLNQPDLETVATEARNFIDTKYTFEKTVREWKNYLSR
jgi:glycosyltransferase involved in cell wall biosynthesis